jgi:Outer membrane efflux protein
MKKSASPGRLIPCIVLITLLFLAGAMNARAQNRYPPALPPPAPELAFIDTANYPFADPIEAKLVKLALEGPLFQGTKNQNRINELQLRTAKSQWQNLLTLSLNYNDQTFAKPGSLGTNTYVYPKYFFGFNIPLGTLFSRTQVKAAREQIEISKATQAQLARTIRADVVTKYRQYKTKNELLKLQSQLVDDEQAVFLQVQKSFQKGTVTIEVYSIEQKRYNDDLAARINLQLDRDVIQLSIEEMIGTNLESVIIKK